MSIDQGLVHRILLFFAVLIGLVIWVIIGVVACTDINLRINTPPSDGLFYFAVTDAALWLGAWGTSESMSS